MLPTFSKKKAGEFKAAINKKKKTAACSRAFEAAYT
jgi:hypothetical protein